MKKIILCIASICLCISVFAQRPSATMQQVNEFMRNSTMYVVLYENPLTNYNSEIRKAVEKNWTLTPFKTVYMSDLESKLNDPKNAFLIPVTMQFGEDKDSVQYTFLSLLIGGEYETINDLPEICTFPLSYDGAEDEMTYKFPAIISFFNNHVPNIVENPKLLKDKRYATYTNQKSSISDKRIFLVKEEQNEAFDSEDEILAVCPSVSVAFADVTAMEKIIRRKEANALFLHIVSPTEEDMVPGRSYTILMDVFGTMYYYGYHTITDKTPAGMTAKEWKALAGYIK